MYDDVVGVIDLRRKDRSIYSTDHVGDICPTSTGDKLNGPIFMVDGVDYSASTLGVAEDRPIWEICNGRRSGVPRCELFVMAMVPPDQLPKPYLSEAFKSYKTDHPLISNVAALSILSNSKYAHGEYDVSSRLGREEGIDFIISAYPHYIDMSDKDHNSMSGGCTVSYALLVGARTAKASFPTRRTVTVTHNDLKQVYPDCYVTLCYEPTSPSVDTATPCPDLKQVYLAALDCDYSLYSWLVRNDEEAAGEVEVRTYYQVHENIQI